MAKDRRNKDQKRKAKLVERKQKEKSREYRTPYEGKKYQAEAWVPAVYATEWPVHQTIVASDRFLTNAVVKEVFLELIESLHGGDSPVLPPDTPPVVYERGKEKEFLLWSIRTSWAKFFERYGPVSHADLIGILRTLLYSIQAHQWNRGADRGYVSFLWDFFKEARRDQESNSIEVSEELYDRVANLAPGEILVLKGEDTKQIPEI